MVSHGQAGNVGSWRTVTGKKKKIKIKEEQTEIMLGGVRICAVNSHVRVKNVPTLILGGFVCFKGELCYVQVFHFTRFLNICFKVLQLLPSLKLV